MSFVRNEILQVAELPSSPLSVFSVLRSSTAFAQSAASSRSGFCRRAGSGSAATRSSKSSADGVSMARSPDAERQTITIIEGEF